MPGGRPTDDPKQKLVAIRLAARQLRVVQARARREGIGLSEAVRRCLDEWVALNPSSSPRTRRPTQEERKMFDEVFAAFGLKPRRRGRRRR